MIDHERRRGPADGTEQIPAGGALSLWGETNPMKATSYEGIQGMKRSCATCMFFDGDHGGTLMGEGLCRGVPPTVLPGDEKCQTIWPTVNKDDWCGTWQAADDDKSRSD